MFRSTPTLLTQKHIFLEEIVKEDTLKLAIKLLTKFKQQETFAEKVNLACGRSGYVERVGELIDDWSDVGGFGTKNF